MSLNRFVPALENALEWNTPVGPCPCFEASCCCPQYDMITKMYYDRGYWDKMNFCWGTGCLAGDGYFIANNRKFILSSPSSLFLYSELLLRNPKFRTSLSSVGQHVFCCSDTGECMNGLCEGCYYTSMCGDRVRFVRYEKIWWCCSIYAGCCNNYCGLAGLKNGQPTGCPEPTVTCLEPGTGEQLTESINAARAKWMSRVGQMSV